MVKMVVTDLDETLLKSDKTIPAGVYSIFLRNLSRHSQKFLQRLMGYIMLILM